MSVAKPTTVPRWASANPSSSTVTPPANTAAIPNWAAGPFTPGQLTMRGGQEYVVISIAGTGTSTTGPTGSSNPVPIDNPGANQVQWGWVASVPTTQDSGFQPNTQPPAQYFNWLFYWIYLWILWLQDIANQDFTSSGVGPWTGPHLFTGGGGPGSAALMVLAGISGGSPGIDGISSTGFTNPAGPAGRGLVGIGGPPGVGQDGGAGVYGEGTGEQAGGTFQGGTSGTTSGGDGVVSTGGPSGRGATLLGGPVPSGGGSAGMGAEITGGDGANGAEMVGGSAISGTGGNGAQMSGGGGESIGGVGIGTGAQPGLAGANLGGTGPGVEGITSSTGSAVQGKVISGTAAALEANNGGILFSDTGSQTQTPAAHVMSGTQYPKAVLVLYFTSGVGFVVKRHTNVTPSSVSVVGGSTIQFSFGVDMADVDYGFTYGAGGAGNPKIVQYITGINTVHTAQYAVFDITSTGASATNLSAFTGQITITIWGDQ